MSATPPAPGSVPAARSCGACDLCCRLLAIHWPEFPDLDKPAGPACKHLVAGVGCAIHAARPLHCARFQCLWLMGFGPDAMRPDAVGGFFTAIDAGRLVLHADPARPDPRTVPEVDAFVRDWLARRRASLVAYRGGQEAAERGRGRGR